ncbi:MAG: low molecular weight phosphatase family protein [Elusimicrobia bacterium]|nr:low molecular weight phosphatase family protein [Elusimicrobiota bacterium]
MPTILFVCVHNACRSQIAETLCRKMAPGWTAASAGSNPSTQVDSKAMEILRQHGLAMSTPEPRGFQELPPLEWDYVVGMGCGDKCPSNLRAKRFIQWDIPDPEDGPKDLYQALYDDLEGRIKNLIQEFSR